MKLKELYLNQPTAKQLTELELSIVWNIKHLAKVDPMQKELGELLAEVQTITGGGKI
jgi:hypothetical protein